MKQVTYGMSEMFNGEADKFTLDIGNISVISGCGCCGSPVIGCEEYPARELAEVIRKAVQEYVDSK